MSHILIVEDERHIADGLRFNLEADGHSVAVVENGEDALEEFQSGRVHFDLLILDVMLPGLDGFAVMTQLRAAGEFVPTLMLTARGRPEDVLKGFEAGTDDYLPKPFELPILLARIKGLLRRRDWLQRQPARRDVFEFSGRIIDFDNLELRRAEKRLQLTLMEATLLRYLIERVGQVCSRQKLLEEVWGVREDTDTRAIDNFIVRLRRYIEDDPAKPQHLLTVRGVGYKFLSQASQ